MIGIVSSVARRLLRYTGRELVETKCSPTFDGALLRLRNRGDQLFNTVIDVGASDGRWSEKVMGYYPSAEYMLIEAQPIHHPRLKAFCAQHRNAQFVLAVAGDREGEIEFDASDPFGGVASHSPLPGGVRLPMTTIDGVVGRYGLKAPYLLKLDTHGFEVSILRGASETLNKVNLLIMECYTFPLTNECLLFHEMCRNLTQSGFRCVDLFEPLYRPRDGVLWQMDLVFMRADRPEFTDLAYH